MNNSDTNCHSAECAALQGTFDELLDREWLLSNERGAFASGTVLGCPTRRYHGLLIAPKSPPLQRYAMLSGMLDKVTVGDTSVEFGSFEFPGTFHPQGHKYLTNFEMDLSATDQWVRFTYRCGQIELARQLTLSNTADLLRISYRIKADPDQMISAEFAPLLSMRDFHDLRQQSATDPWTAAKSENGLWAQDKLDPALSLFIFPVEGEGLAPVGVTLDPQWWHDFRYRVELARGMAGGEDLCRLGVFNVSGKGTIVAEIVVAGFPESPAHAKAMHQQLRSPERTSYKIPGVESDDAIRNKLVSAANQFVVKRGAGSENESATILAGYPWFGDWGRDAFISLEGLLLCTGRHEEAKDVLATFAGAQRNGMIPNLFSDYGDDCAYNSVDASLWYIHAADAYFRYTKDEATWSELLLPTCLKVVDAYSAGTDFGIVVDDRGLLRCGDPSTQLTWMDAQVNGVPVTPRHGFPVEVNALWYRGLRALLEPDKGLDEKRRAKLTALAEKFAAAFESVFWNEADSCLFDYVQDSGPDGAVRPNQIFAVSLPYSPLSEDKQVAVLKKVREHLLTPVGLRSLSPADSRYCGRHEGDSQKRDSAYHNGTVWGWLIGPFVEAHLRVNGSSSKAKSEARAMLAPLIQHMSSACLGQISEIFSGDPPHHPRGCFAQAWSVAEVLRAYDLIAHSVQV